MTTRASLNFSTSSDKLDGASLSGLSTSTWTIEIRMDPTDTITTGPNGEIYVLDTDAGGDVSTGAFQLIFAGSLISAAVVKALPSIHANNQSSATSNNCPVMFNQQTMLSITKNSSNLVTFYANGVVLGAATHANNPSFSAANLMVGRSRYNHIGSPYFKGKIESMRFWSVVRTQADIQGDFNSTPSTTTGLHRYWPMEEGSGTTVTDTVASAALTITGATWSSEDWDCTPYTPCVTVPEARGPF